MTRLVAALALLLLVTACDASPARSAGGPEREVGGVPTDEPVVPEASERQDRPWLPRRIAGQTHGLDLGGRLPWPVDSRRTGVRAVLLGGDGATLFPFEAVARRADGAWRVSEVEQWRAMPYATGAVVLPDGRLLVRLDHWSSDRGPHRPASQHHGLWVSAGADWSRYVPYRGARFSGLLRDRVG